jgi:long-subunit acyl-CoA synthetase (AMP-forming)
MKHSQLIGLLSVLAMIAVCFLPWSFIASKQLTVTGMNAMGTYFGKPGLFNVIVCCIMMILFAVPAVWSKRTNVFLAAINLAWAFRNYLLVSACMMGECPEKKPALFALVGLALVIQVMALLPKIDVKNK